MILPEARLNSSTGHGSQSYWPRKDSSDFNEAMPNSQTAASDRFITAAIRLKRFFPMYNHPAFDGPGLLQDYSVPGKPDQKLANPQKRSKGIG
jgi:hypothetical protein